MRIIINADDLGYDMVVNERICHLLRENLVSSATIIANAPAVEDAVERTKGLSDCSFGVHLNLTEFQPLTKSSRRLEALSSCLNEKGFFRGEERLGEIRYTSALGEAIFMEWVLQVEKVLRLGIRVSHLDSHNHVHTLPMLFPVVKRVQRHLGIRKMRTTWNIHREKGNVVSGLKKVAWHWAMRNIYRTRTTSGFTSLADLVAVGTSRRLNHESIEVMVHPGHADFEPETQLLYSDWRERILVPTEVINYHNL